jgi:hypothetical protein
MNSVAWAQPAKNPGGRSNWLDNDFSPGNEKQLPQLPADLKNREPSN